MKRHTIFGKKLTLFVTILLCLVMAFCSVACGGGDGDNGGNNGDNNQTNTGNNGGNTGDNDDNTGDDNTGDDNTGDDNTGDDNTGDDDFGDDEDDDVIGDIGGGGNGDGDQYETLKISLKASSDGYGTRALRLQAERFGQAFKNKIYTAADGTTYKGVELTVEADKHSPSPTASWLQESIAMYNASTTYSSVESAYRNGYIANIDYILRKQIPGDPVGSTIASKFYPEMAYAYGVTNESSTTSPDKFDLVGIPFAQTVSGFMYDKDLFAEGYYIAAPDAADANEFMSDLLDGTQFDDYKYVNFVDGEGEKSVGPNGNPGDYDDGLPSSFLEFIVLCEKLASDNIAPFIYSGEYPSYLSLGFGAMLFSMLGYENARAMQEFTSSSLNIVTGFEDTDLFNEAMSSDMNVKIPKVTQISMEESSGYYHSWTLENYLILALADLMNTQGWKNYSATNSRSHTETQYDFIFGIEPDARDHGGAMLPEGSYWYNESIDANNFNEYNKYYEKLPDDRGIAWMSLPVNIYAPVTGENKEVTNFGVTESVKGEPQTLDDIGGGALMVNGRYKDDPAVMAAVEDYLLFKCSDAELNKFAVDAGYTMQLKYTYNDDIMMSAPKYIQDTFQLFGESNIVTMFASSKTWRDRPDYTFMRSYNSSFFVPREKLNYNDGPAGFVTEKDGAVGAFKHNLLDYDEWWQYYKGEQGEHNPPTYAKYPVGHPKAGEDVVFEG